MPDHEPDAARPPSLPARGRPPVFVPTEAALHRALTRARHRKLTRGLSLSLAVLAVPAAVVLSLPEPGREDSLQLGRTPSAVHAPGVPPGPTPVPVPAASPAAVSLGDTGQAAAAQAAPAPSGQNALQPSTVPSQVRQRLPRGATKPEHVERPRVTTGRDCGQVQESGTTLSFYSCLRGRSPFTVRRGALVDLVTSFCLSPYWTGAIRLEFRGGQEHEIIVRQTDEDADGRDTGKGRILWTWSHTVVFPQGPHTRTLAPDRCLEWDTQWRTQDQSGRLLPPGKYFLEHRMTATHEGGSVGGALEIVD